MGQDSPPARHGAARLTFHAAMYARCVKHKLECVMQTRGRGRPPLKPKPQSSPSAPRGSAMGGAGLGELQQWSAQGGRTTGRHKGSSSASGGGTSAGEAPSASHSKRRSSGHTWWDFFPEPPQPVWGVRPPASTAVTGEKLRRWGGKWTFWAGSVGPFRTMAAGF